MDLTGVAFVMATSRPTPKAVTSLSIPRASPNDDLDLEVDAISAKKDPQ